MISCDDRCCQKKLENCFRNLIGPPTACQHPRVPLWTLVFSLKVILQVEVVRYYVPITSGGDVLILAN